MYSLILKEKVNQRSNFLQEDQTFDCSEGWLVLIITRGILKSSHS